MLEDRLAALAKLGQMEEWLNIRTPSGIEGFAAAWFLTEVSAMPVSVPAERAAGEQRALDFLHQPSFVCLPLLGSARDIHTFNGFGPNNFAYFQFREKNGEIYKNLFGLHNGLDFMVPFGTGLCAVDWGLVVQVSSRDNDTPLGAKPRSVTVLYGNMLTLYGHMSDTSAVNVGDIVAPGDPIGLSGKDPSDGAHLHFETREVRPNFLQKFKDQIEMNGLAATMGQWFRIGDARGNVRAFTNPAPFFTTPLETYRWGSACPMPDVDRDSNGYPDRILRPDEMMPTAFDLYWKASFFPPLTGSFWDGCQEV